jgi:protein tyrosine/serine phosphatase
MVSLSSRQAFRETSMTRHIDLEGVDNFRDFGGYKTACGRGLKRGVLYRSANYARATDADLERLKALGVSVIVDLRRSDEKARDPSRRWADFAAEVIENDIDGDAADWAHSFINSDTTTERVREGMRAFYRRAPTEPRHVDLYRRYFRALADAPGAVIVHCTAGKDRTGIACALTHHIAGVGREDLVADYLLTNDEARLARRVAAIGGRLSNHLGRTIDEEALRAALSVDEEYLEAAFAEMTTTYGGLDGYLEEVLGVDAPLREKIAERILA